MPTSAAAEHALVIGSGIGGMCAARVLSQHYRRVTIVERDSLPSGPEHRPGVPQSHHGHGLLLRGLYQIDALFPGFAELLLAGGAHRVDLGNEFGHFTEWGWSPRAKTDVLPISANRLLIEHSIRQLLRVQLPNVEIRERARVLELSIDRSAGLQVNGVEVQGTHGRELIHADLVVDSSGRNGKMLQWFETLGLPAPQVDFIDADAAYASRFYRMPSPRPTDWWWKGLLIEGKPPGELRGAMLLPCGGDLLVLMLIGVNGDHPPTDEEGYGAYMRSLRTPYLAQAIALCEAVSPIHGAKPLFNRWRRMDRWQGELPGYLCIGDGLVTFNPFHGQGMTAAAVAAGDLGRVLAKVGTCPARLPKAFYAESKKFIRDAWTVSTTIDLCWPQTKGHRPLLLPLLWPLLRQVGQSVHEDTQLQRMLGKLFHLVDPPAVMLRPRVLLRLLYTIVRRALLGPAVAPNHNPMLSPGPGEGAEGAAAPSVLDSVQ